MKTNYNLFDNNASGLNILVNGDSECAENKLFKTANEALENLYEIYNESVSRFIEYKAAAYLEKLVVENAIFEKEAETILNESCETQEYMDDLTVNLKEWVDVLNTSVNSLDNWNHCIETSKTILNLLEDNNMSEEKTLKSIKEVLIGFKGITLNMESYKTQNLEEKGDLDMKNSRVSKLISDKELTLNGLKPVSESMELLEDLNAFEKSIIDLKVKIYDNDGEVTQEAYEMLLDLDVLEEGLKAKIKAAGEKRIDKKIAKKEAQIEKIKARLEKEKADFDISEYEEDLKACEEKGDEKGAAKIRKRIERMKDNHAYDIEEMEEDIKTIEGEIEKLRSKRGASAEEVAQESYLSLVFDGEDLGDEYIEEGLKEKLVQIKDKSVAKKIAKKEAQIEKIKARLEKEKADFDISEYEEDLKACEEKGDEKGAAKIEKKIAKMKDNHAYDIEEMEEDIKTIEGEIAKLKEKVKANDGEMTQEAYTILESLDVLEEGLKEKVAAKMSGIKDKRVAKKIAKKEAQIEKLRAKIEKEKEAHKNYLEDFEGDLEYCREKGDEKGAAKIEKKIAKEKENHAYDIEEMEEDIKIIEGEIAKLKEKVKANDGEMTQEAYTILENLDVLEEGLKAKVKAIGDKRLNKKLAKRENLLGKMKQMLLDVQDEEHKVKIQSDITDLEADIEKIRAKMNKNIDEVVQESYLDVIFEYTIYDIIDEEEYTEEGLRQKLRDMKDNGLNKKINKKEAKLAEMKIRLGEMQTPEDDKKKAKLEKDIEKLEQEVQKLKGKVKSEPGDNIVEGEGTQESTEIDDENVSLEAYEIQMLEAQLEEMEAKIEAKQQVLNESYSYRTEVELKVLEEGLKEVKGKLEGVREKLADKCYNWVAKKYTSQTRIEYHLDELKATIEDAENLLKSREGESKGDKAKRLAGNIVTLMVCAPLLVVLRQSATVLSSEKNLRTTLKYAKMEMAAFRKRLNELNGQGNGEEEAPAQEMFSVEEAAELSMMFDALIEQEEKIEAKQQVLNESYSYRTEIELEVLEEGLKDIKAKIGAKMDARREKKYDKKMKKAKSETELRRHIEDLKIKIERAETVKKEKESESKAKKAAKIVGSIVAAVGLGIVITGPTNKQLDKAIKYAQMEIKASEKRIADLENLKGKGEEAPQEPAQEMFSVEEAAEIMALIESIIEQEEKIEAKQQVLNESYSYRTEIELEVLEEGLKDAKEKASAKANDMLVKVYKTPEKLRNAIEKEKKFIEEAEACLQSREEDSSKIKKFAKMVGRSLVYAMAGNAIQPKVSLGANPSKVIRKHIKSSQQLIAAAERRLAKLEGENKQEEAPAQESVDYAQILAEELAKIDFED